MLHRISIQNYAIIEQLELNFSNQLTVITGETGAGKSIVMEALSLVLGERADTSVLFDKSKKCSVEADFDVSKIDLKTFFEANDLDEESTLTLRREIASTGKSRAFVNDTPVNLSVMKFLGEQLVDMHQQHESQEISTAQFQLSLLDSLTESEDTVAEFRKNFFDHQKKLNRLNQLREQHRREAEELDYLNFQLGEISNASLKEGEQENLQSEEQQLEHAGEILRGYSSVLNILQESETAVIPQLKNILTLFSSLKKFYSGAEEILKRIESVRIEVEDIGNEIEREQEKISVNPERLEEIQQRLDLIFRLQKKHRVNDVISLIHIAEALENKINSISIHTEKLEELTQEIKAQKKLLIQAAKKISAARVKVSPKVVQAVNSMLKDVGMVHAQIKIEHELLNDDEIDANGLDHFNFLFASNKGSAFQEIGKVASGGELSRLMLCFKSLIADSTQLPTLIFDEIDSGISGETAVRVSKILKQLASNHQVICITHLPQLAAKGDTHYFVFKEIMQGRTHTRVRSLSQAEKIKTIAQMIAGEKITAAALESAKELLN